MAICGNNERKANVWKKENTTYGRIDNLCVMCGEKKYVAMMTSMYDWKRINTMW